MTGNISAVKVTLTGLTQLDTADDIDMLLVAPDGPSLIILSDVGGVNIANNVTITLDDAASNPLPAAADSAVQPPSF